MLRQLSRIAFEVTVVNSSDDSIYLNPREVHIDGVVCDGESVVVNPKLDGYEFIPKWRAHKVRAGRTDRVTVSAADSVLRGMPPGVATCKFFVSVGLTAFASASKIRTNEVTLHVVH